MFCEKHKNLVNKLTKLKTRNNITYILLIKGVKNMGENIYNKFTKQYSLSKTLRFELRPQGKTLDFIMKSGILGEDEKRAEDYKPVKKIIDSYHKEFIEKILSKIILEGLDEYYTLYSNKNRDEKEFSDIKTKLRKQIAENFKKVDGFDNLLKPGTMLELIKDNAKKEELEVMKSFDKFGTYFQGFIENRKNMYVADEKSTSIAYRIVNDNLPRYIDNMKIYDIVMSTELCTDMIKLETELSEVLNDKKIEDYFKLDNYSWVLSNTDIEAYNLLLIGKKFEDGTQIKGINQYINEFNMKNKKNSNIRKIPKLKILYKQILSDKQTFSFVDEQFNNDNMVIDAVHEVSIDIYNSILKKEANNSIEKLFNNISKYNLEKIYISNGQNLNNLSNSLFGDWSQINNCLKEEYDEINIKKKRNEKYYENREKALKNKKYYSIAYINSVINKYTNKEIYVEDYYRTLGKKEGNNLLQNFELAYEKSQALINVPYESKHGLCSDKKSVGILKELLDAIKHIEEFVKPLLAAKEEGDKDELFYSELDVIYNKISQIIPIYNKVRNYVTRKPYSTEKIKLNFQNPTLLKGWDLNKERDNLSVILRKDGNYYLGIMNKKYNKAFLEDIPNEEGEFYEKVEYKLLPGPNKMLPKVFFGKSNLDIFNPSNEIIENYEKGTHKLGDNFDLNKCHQLIDYFKESISKHEDWSKFGFKFTDTEKYADISQFYHEVEKQGYSIKLKNIPTKYIDDLVETGKLYLFQIYNKDFSPHSKGTPNLHTLYWKMLFDERNLENVVYKLNGEAEVFFRKASIKDDIVIHKKNVPIEKKNIEAKSNNEVSIFNYDITKDKRYTVDKFQFHVPITLNFCAEGRNYLNEKVISAIRDNSDINVIGIDRGERNLLYICVVSPDGKIIEQKSLNKIDNGGGHETDYHELLDIRENEMNQARKNWLDINSIKELKEGYLSQAIHIITDLMVKHNAIVVLEDLNFGFMNGRKKVGKQVYQKFEKMLIDKLNYLVDKKIDADEDGGLLNAYQLTNQFDSFAKLGKQSGFLFYIPAWNTSKIDPTTGFVNLLYPKYTNMTQAKEFIKKFDRISFNKHENYFEFQFDYKNFTDREAGKKTQWTLCSYGERLLSFKNPKNNNKRDSKEVNLTNHIMQHMKEYDIDINKENLVEQICNVEDVSFFKKLIDDINLILQIRNNKPHTDIDYMLSPVKNEKGEFFDTREYDEDDNEKNYFPKDADANGAYNIARKGLCIIEKIRQQNGNKVNLAISNKEWLEYAQNNVIN